MVAVFPWPLFWGLRWLGTLCRENSLTVRSAGCRVPGEGWAWGSFLLQLERGVGFQRAGLGEGSPPSLAVREQALGASGADSFLSRAGGPRDCSPLSGLGGERPKGEGEQEGRPGAIWPGWGVVGGRAPTLFC